MKNSERNKRIIQKRQAKKKAMAYPGRKSNYTKKKEFLHSNGGFGFQYEDKPWKQRRSQQKMAILNYTTKITAEKTASEIQRKLADAKAQAVLCEYDDDGVMCAMSFRIKSPGEPIFFRLPANIAGVYRSICNDPNIPKRLRTKEQATRVAWRILKDWIEAQLAIVEAEMADIKEVFLPYAQNKAGQTLYEAIKDNGFKLLAE